MNGEGTHEWRLGELEKRMDRLERRIQTAMYALIGNLVGVCVLLIVKILEHSGK